MPAGSTSNYFRTRSALLQGIVDRFVERDKLDWAAVGKSPLPQNIEQVIDAACRWMLHALGPERTRTSARYALMLEAAENATLQPPLRAARERLVAWVTGLLAAVSGDPANHGPIVMDYLEGVILHQLCMPEAEFDPRPTLARLLGTLAGSHSP